MHRRTPIRFGAVLMTVLATTLVAAGCGDDGSSTSSTTSTSTTPVVGGTATVGGVTTGVAKCDTAQVGKAVAETGKAEGSTAKLDPGGLKCADGWAVAFADVGTGDQAVTVTYVFEAEGQFWIPKDRSKVCPKPSPVPAALYQDACESN